jgi:GT2 family glycosyltransferase
MSTGSGRAPTLGVITLWYRAGRPAIERFAANVDLLENPSPRLIFVIQDQSAEEVRHLRQRLPHATILEPGTNLGTAAGWNLGIRHLLEEGATYIAIWNVDVWLDGRCLQRLVAVMQQQPAIGACQPLLLYSDEPDLVQMFGGSFDVVTGEGRHDCNGATRFAQLPASRDADYLDGGSMLMRAEALRATGGFDERLFMYAEDADLCHRLRRHGYRTVAVRDAMAWHYHREERGSLPAPYQLFYETRNRLFVVMKLAGWRAWVGLVARLVVGLPRQVLYYYHERRLCLVWPYVLGILYGVSLRMGKQGWVQ